MALHLIHFIDYVAAGKIELTITNNDSSLSGDSYYHLISIGDISVGNDKESEYIYMPSGFDVRGKVVDDNIKTIINALSLGTNYSELKLNGAICHRGFVNNNSVSGNPLTKEIKFRCEDHTIKLKELTPSANPYGFSLTGTQKVKTTLYYLLTEPSIFPHPFILDVNYHGTVQVKHNIGGSDVIFDFDLFYILNNDFFGTDNNYQTVAELFKSLIINYNCIGYVELDRILHLVPRTYEGQGFTNINTDDLLSEVTYSVNLKEIEGMLLMLWSGGTPKANDNSWGRYQYGNVNADNEKDNTKVEKIYLTQPCGEFMVNNYPESFSGLYVYQGANQYEIQIDWNCRKKDINGNYTDWDYLWKIIGEETWNYLSSNPLRETYTLKLKGLSEKWNFHTYYKTIFSDRIFRIVKAKYNFYKNQTEVILKQVD